MKRRDVLKRVGAGLATSATAGVATARDTERFNQQIDPENARRVIDEHQDLLAELAADGVIESASADAFDLETAASPHEAADGVALTRARVTDERGRQLLVSRSVEDGELVVGVRLERDGAYARLHGNDGSVSTYGVETIDGAPAILCPHGCYFYCETWYLCGCKCD